METLTERQQQVLAYLTDTIRQTGRPPTLREMTAHFGWRSDNSARQHLRLLRQKGAIEYDEGIARGIRLSPQLEAVQLREVALVGRVAAGLPIEAIENIEGSVGIDADLFPEAEVFALRVSGDSMVDVGIRDGDIALIRKSEEATDGDIVIALLNGEATLKRYIRKGPNALLRAENKQFADLAVTPEDDFRVVGLAIGIMRRL